VIKNPAARFVAAAILVGGLAIAPLLDNSDSRDSPFDTPSSLSDPEFRILWKRGELVLSGHTRSVEHEQNLVQVANASFANAAVATAFEPLGVVPDYWADLTTRILYLLAETSSADATVSVHQVTIRGVIVNEFAWQSRLAAIRNALPETISVNTDTLLVDDATNVSGFCERAFESFEVGAINFEESSIDFRSSAYPRLDRLLALANACDESRISITGHTDSTGSDAWNKRLSLQRANAVGDYLVAGGVDLARLQIVAAGSMFPIADDGTRYGRGLNRRIEIKSALAASPD
jgi:outer membrane protein OmpA-like peptidoglycan-associated protein